MLETLAKLFGTWFGNPIRGLATIMLSSIITLLLWQYPPFGDAMKDTFWRWPCLAAIVSATGLATYPVAYAWKVAMGKRREAVSVKKCIVRLSTLTPHEKHVLEKYQKNRFLKTYPSRHVPLVKNQLFHC